MSNNRKQILLVNDDGIASPGIWAAADALSELGDVCVAAPLEQSSGMGRAMPYYFDGTINLFEMEIKGVRRQGYSVNGAPAQVVQAGIMGILKAKPDLVVSGINYGSNMGIGITASGTVGAAMEGAAFGVPSLAISLETDVSEHFTHSEEIDFSASAFFTHYFAQKLLENHPLGVNLLKVEVPVGATTDTPWKTTRLSTHRYFTFTPPQDVVWGKPIKVSYNINRNDHPENSDAYVMHHDNLVAVTPITLDMTANVSLEEYQRLLAA